MDYPAPESDASPIALLIIAHGSRRAEANFELVELAESLRRQSHYHLIEIAYLELATPTIAEGACHCVEKGARQVVLLPYFLSSGVHVRQDLQMSCSELTKRYPGVGFVLAEPLGKHPLLTQILWQRAQEALLNQQGNRPDKQHD